MIRKFLLIVLFIGLTVLFSEKIVFAEVNPKTEIYFNAGTEQYLNSDFIGAVENLEKALKLTPQNNKIKQFLVKVLLEGGEHYHLRRNYRQALVFLEKAKKLAPENKEVDELYQITQRLVEKPAPLTQEVKEEHPPSPPPLTTKPVPKPKPVPSPPSPLEVPKIIVQEKVVSPFKVSSTLRSRTEGNSQGEPPLTQIKLSAEKTLIAILVVSLSVLIFVFLSVNYLIFKKLKIAISSLDNSLKQKVNQLTEEIKTVNQAQIKFCQGLLNPYLEGEKNRETKLDLRLGKLKMDILDELKKVMPKKKTKSLEQTLLLQQQERILSELRGEKLPVSVDIFLGEPESLQEARQQMIRAAISLYQFNPELALKTLKEMVASSNPAIRINTILALSEISSSEAVKILLDLITETDDSVKKVLLSVLLQLKEKSSLAEDIRQKISSTLKEEKLKKEWIF